MRVSGIDDTVENLNASLKGWKTQFRWKLQQNGFGEVYGNLG